MTKLRKKNKKGLKLKHYLFILGGGLLAFIFILLFSISQEGFNKEIYASEKCSNVPQIKIKNSELLKNSKGKVYANKYSLKIWNDSKTTCEKKLSYFFMKDINHTPIGWEYVSGNHNLGKFLNSFVGDLYPQESHTLKLTIKNPKNLNNGSYKLPFKICQTNRVCGTSSCTSSDIDTVWLTYFFGRTSNCSKLNLDYLKK